MGTTEIVVQADEVAACWEANAEAWTVHSRAGYDVCRDKHNTPAFLAMLPEIDGLTGLDIGCGEGSNTRQLARLGAKMKAIDIAPTFIRHAQASEEAEPLGIDYCVADGQELPFAVESFDFVAAFMSLMDIPDQPRVLGEAARVLRPGGFLQFSILHPCFVPPHRKVLREPDGTPRAIEIARYFDNAAGEVETWWFSALPREQRGDYPPFRIPRFHRTLSSWLGIVVDAGLSIEKLGEPCATEEEARAIPAVDDTRIAPLFLHIRARKPERQLL
jgi:2-polyprenyl-3-methyl-5-hydroxy-6-metoxy-1,4-benzoquinol methylase